MAFAVNPKDCTRQLPAITFKKHILDVISNLLHHLVFLSFFFFALVDTFGVFPFSSSGLSFACVASRMCARAVDWLYVGHHFLSRVIKKRMSVWLSRFFCCFMIQLLNMWVIKIFIVNELIPSSRSSFMIEEVATFFFFCCSCPSFRWTHSGRSSYAQVKTRLLSFLTLDCEWKHGECIGPNFVVLPKWFNEIFF